MRETRDSDSRRRPSSAREWVTVPATKKTRRRDPLWARLLVVAGAILMVTSGGVIVGGSALIAQTTNSIDNTDLLGEAGSEPKGKTLNGALNMLLVGIDVRPDNKPGEPIRSDSIIILHVPASHDQAYLVSVPRDLLVQIPGMKSPQVNAQRSKVNAAFGLGFEKGGRAGGFKVLAATLKQATGLEFNAAAIVDFGGFNQLVKQLGGVDMCIDQRVESRHIGYDKRTGEQRTPYVGAEGETRDPQSNPKVYEVGCRRLEYWEALDYVRQRKGLPNGDYDRQRHQQQFLKAIMKEAKKQGVTSNPVKAIGMMKAAGDALTVDTLGIPLENWAYTLRNVTDNDMIMLKTNAGQVHGTVDPSLGSVEQLTPASVEMFEHLRKGTLRDFVLQHPEFVATDTIS